MSKQLNNFSNRLKTIMNLSGYRAVDVINQQKLYADEFKGTKLTKQDMSNYISGRTNPLSDKLNLLCRILGVDISYFTNDVAYTNYGKLSNEESMLIRCWRSCLPKDKELISYILKGYGFVYENDAKNEI